MPGLITDKIDKVSSSDTGRPVVALLAAPGYTMGATTININDASNWNTDTAIHFTIYVTQTIGGVAVKDPTTQTDWKGTLSGTVISNLVRTGGNDRDYSAGAIVELTPTARYAKDLADWALTEHKVDGTHENITADSITADSGTITDLTVTNLSVSGASSSGGWTPLGATPNTITNNGNRSYTLVYNGTDLTDDLSPGMRVRHTRTVTAPTQCADLESSSSQYFSRASASVAGMTFTDDFTCSAWVKPESYTTGVIVSRITGATGFQMYMVNTGQIEIGGGNGSVDSARSYQSLPLGQWTHVAATLDISGAVSTMYFNGIAVPTAYTNNAATALTQSGDFYIGRNDSGNYFDGKIAQVSVHSAILTQAQIRAMMNQTIDSSTPNIVAGYTFNGVLTDVSANANTLTANGGALATNADSPFSVNSFGTATGTTDYGIVTSCTFSTNTTVVVQVPEGNTIPTTGGVSAVSYSGIKAPYGMPVQKGKWRLESSYISRNTKSSPVAATAYNVGGERLDVPLGSWQLGYECTLWASGTSAIRNGYVDLNTSTVSGAYPTSTGAVIDKKSDWAASTYSAASTDIATTIKREAPTSLSSSTVYNLNVMENGTGTINTIGFLHDFSKAVIYAELAYL